jgi:Fe-S-cluster containining protein
MNFDFPHDVRFKCVRCGICCGDTPAKTRHILLLKTEAKQISNSTKMAIGEFALEIEGKEPYSYEMIKTVKESKCIFLKEKICTIYAKRPLICRFYPFELKAIESRKHKFAHTDECPGIGKGRTLKHEYFLKLLRLAACKLKK